MHSLCVRAPLPYRILFFSILHKLIYVKIVLRKWVKIVKKISWKPLKFSIIVSKKEMAGLDLYVKTNKIKNMKH